MPEPVFLAGELVTLPNVASVRMKRAAVSHNWGDSATGMAVTLMTFHPTYSSQ
jgi:hypothetical protein